MILPDVTDECLEDRPGKLETLIKEQAGSRLVIGLLGELSLRKGILTFLAAARLAASSGEKWLFVCAGPLDYKSCLPEEEKTIRKAIATAGPNCLFHLERIPDGHEYNAAVRACDVLYAAYWVLASTSAIRNKLCRQFAQ
jgi:glycosyltransferase involved in cell wall biosynthesis